MASDETTFEHGEVVEYECNSGDTIRVIFDSMHDFGLALVFSRSDPDDGFFVKLTELRKIKIQKETK